MDKKEGSLGLLGTQSGPECGACSPAWLVVVLFVVSELFLSMAVIIGSLLQKQKCSKEHQRLFVRFSCV